jgi:argininosuccinate lyase
MARRAKGRKDLLRGRFASGVHPALDRINRSFEVDRRLWREDIEGSVAHARMLGARRILPRAAVARILRGLAAVRREFERGTFRPRPEDEDIHTAVERRLTELIGPDGGRLHTARSRNDQVATDLRLHLRRSSSRIAEAVRALQRSLVRAAGRDGDAILPFYTHLQRAQPVLLGHTLLAWVELLESDRAGLAVSDDACPLGSGAGAGVGFPIDPRITAHSLGFRSPTRNSIASVSSRRDATAFLGALALLATTLSRLGAEIVLWTSREFGFARLADSVSTGSSIMPQKRNPDGAELLRAKAAVVASAFGALLEIQRGLPLGYSKDLQEDKALLFGAEDAVLAMLEVAEAMTSAISFDRRRMRAAAEDPAGYLLATEAADWLARRGVPFREAHRAVGALVREAERRGLALRDLPDDALRRAHPRFDPTVRRALTLEAAVAARRAIGGTAPGNLRRELARWRRLLGVRPPRARG